MYQAIILGSLLFITLYILKRKREPELTMPPLVSYKFPIIGHTFDFFLNPEKFLKQCREEYGDIFCLYIWGQVRVFVGKEHFGEEESQHEEVLNSFANFIIDSMIFLTIPPFLDIIYPGLQEYVNQKQVCKRLQEKEKYGDSWKRPDDHLQDLMEEHDPNNISLSHQRPEYMQELYEEQLKVHKETNVNGIIPFEALSDMKKLDSFIRETLRLSVNVAGIDHLVKKDYTFSNGLQIPKNCITSIYIDDVYRDEPKSFEPFRHLDINIASKVTKNFLTFGMVNTHALERQLAVNNIKFFMHNVILKYNFRTVSSKIEESRGTGFYGITS
ncbi:unnamed protein product [Rhizophagus irregularis]|nr:unnamed protein product [Rhizophagus irregularis]